MELKVEIGALPTPSAPGMDRRRSHASLMMVVVTILWGLSFPLTKNWQNAAATCPAGSLVAGATLICLRIILAGALLALFRPALFTAPRRQEYCAGAAVGLCCGAGFVLQIWGIAHTTPALSAFITSLGSAWVPLLGAIIFGINVRMLTLLGLGLGIAGAAVLAGQEAGGSLLPGGGEWLTLIASLFFAAQILLLDRMGRRYKAAHLTAGFLATVAVISLTVALIGAWPTGLISWSTWLWSMLTNGAIIRDLLLLTVLCTALTFHWMNVYQPRVAAARAALIYLLEPVFAALFSLALGHDPMTVGLLAGGGLILGGNLLAELPGLWRSQSRPPHPDSSPQGKREQAEAQLNGGAKAPSK